MSKFPRQSGYFCVCGCDQVLVKILILLGEKGHVSNWIQHVHNSTEHLLVSLHLCVCTYLTQEWIHKFSLVKFVHNSAGVLNIRHSNSLHEDLNVFQYVFWVKMFPRTFTKKNELHILCSIYLSSRSNMAFETNRQW